MAASGGGMSLGTLWIEIAARVDEATKVLQQFGNDVDGIISEQKKKWDGLADAGAGFAKVGLALSGVTAAMGAVGMASVSAAEGINSARVAFTTMLGSGEKADAMLKDLQKFAATTPFEFTDLVSAAQRMKALGFSADQVIPTLRTVGDTVAASGNMSKESIDGIVLALGQMQMKGKVSAQEMQQLSERGVNAWGALAEAAGITVPEAMKAAEQGAIVAADAIPAILAGMNQKAGGSMEAMSKTLTGQWSNFKDQVTQALIPIGQALIPALSALLPVLSAVMAKVSEGATWFSQLPQPLQNGAIAMAALAAAIGPLLLGLGGIMTAVGTLMPALGGIATFFGTSVGLLGPWGLAIAAVLAALVALGSWVYENWEPITAVLSQAWDGISEMWGAAWGAITSTITAIWSGYVDLLNTIWGPVVNFLLKIWDAVGPYFTAAWNAVAGVLASIWNGIKAVAMEVWNGIVGVFNGFIQAAQKIPGVAKLINLDDAAKSAKGLTTETKALTKEVKAAAVELPKVNVALKEKAEKAKKAKNEVKPLHFEIRALEQAIKDEQAALMKGHKEWLAWSEAHKTAESRTVKLTEVTAEMDKTINTMITSMKNVPPAFVNAEAQAKTSMETAAQKVRDVDAAYKTLGLTSAATFTQTAKDAEAAYNTIKNDANSKTADIERAWVAMELARIAATRASGGEIDAARLKELNDMKARLDTELPKQKGKWEDFSKEVSTIMTNFTQDIGKSLFEGDTSWGEKGKAMLKSLGQAVTNMFVQPFTDAIGGLIQGALKRLLGSEGLGGIFDSLTKIGTKSVEVAADMGKIGTGAAGGAGGGGGGNIPGGGGGGGGAEGIMGFLSGGLFGNILAAGQLGMSVFQSFQFAAMNKTLDLIERYTRYSELLLGSRSDGGILGRLFDISDKVQWIPGQLDAISATLNRMADSLIRIEPLISAGGATLGQILEDGRTREGAGMARFDQIIDAIYGMSARLDTLAMLGSKQIEIQTFGSDPSIVAAKIAAQLRAQGGVA